MFVFLLMIAGGSVLIAAGYELEAVLLTLVGVGLAAATVARYVTDGGRLPSLAWLIRPGGAE